MKKKIVIYTAIFGDYDNLNDTFDFDCDCDFVCFTDNKKIKSSRYKFVYFDAIFDDPVRTAKIFKLLPHIFLHDYDMTLWVDGSVTIKKDPTFYVQDLLKSNDFWAHRHLSRSNVLEEASACIEYCKDNPQLIEKQIAFYRNQNFPDLAALVETTILIRNNHSSKVVTINENWWKQIISYSRRDQLSLNYVLWENNLDIGIIDSGLNNSEYFQVNPHKKDIY